MRRQTVPLRRLTMFALPFFFNLGLSAQSPPTPQSTLTTGTQLIVVDVTVQDKFGKPMHGLKASDFTLLERNATQTLKSFEEHIPPTQSRPVRMPVLPPGTFTDFSPVPDTSALNVILLDLLNTPLTDQAYVMDQLNKYVREPHSSANVAILGLNSSLTVLQDFTSDPAVLKYAVDHKIKLAGSQLLDDPGGNGYTAPSAAAGLAGVMSGSGVSAGAAIAEMRQFESDQTNFELRYRTRATLDAFNSIARFLAHFPGRKNLIWFSGSFPLAVFPDETIEDPFSMIVDNAEDLRVTTNLLDRARVAVYPIDARGVRTMPISDAGGGDMSAINGAPHDTRMNTSSTRTFNTTNAQEHLTMSRMADDTGGRAFFNLNNLGDAVVRAVTDGANYYTLTYSPADRNYKGEFRSIQVNVTAPGSQGQLKLSYRHGYFADDPGNRKIGGSSPILSGKAADAIRAPQSPLRTAMTRGAPAPSEVLFTARVLPDSKGTETLIAADNRPNPDGKFKGPFRRINVDFAAITKDITLPLRADGHHHGEIELVTYVYDVKGKLLNSSGKAIKLDITPEVYEQLKRYGICDRLQISVPATTESLLRIAVHDIPSGRVGAIEVASSDVRRLPPLDSTAAVPAPGHQP